MDLQQYVLMPETDARRVLADRRLALRVLAPVGAYAGVGTLRVLRAQPIAESDGLSSGSAQAVELVCGYEAYDPLPQAQDSGSKV